MSDMQPIREAASRTWRPRMPGEDTVDIILQVVLTLVGFGTWEILSRTL